MENYPDAHPRADEISKIRIDVDAQYATLKTYEQLSRDYYQNAMQSLKSMGDAHKAIHEILKDIARKLDTLKSIIDAPLI